MDAAFSLSGAKKEQLDCGREGDGSQSVRGTTPALFEERHKHVNQVSSQWVKSRNAMHSLAPAAVGTLRCHRRPSFRSLRLLPETPSPGSKCRAFPSSRCLSSSSRQHPVPGRAASQWGREDGQTAATAMKRVVFFFSNDIRSPSVPLSLPALPWLVWHGLHCSFWPVNSPVVRGGRRDEAIAPAAGKQWRRTRAA
jgi:hypothetical protein